MEINIMKTLMPNITIKEDGLNIMTIYQQEVQTVIEYHQNGMDGFIINTMIFHSLIATHSKILSLKSLIVGIIQHQLSNYIHPKQRQLILNFCNTENKDKTNLQLNGHQLLKEHDLSRQIYINIIFLILIFVQNIAVPQILNMGLIITSYPKSFSLLYNKECNFILNQRPPKIIHQFCFEINKQSYNICVDFLKTHKEEKGEKQINYENLWPENFDDPKVKSQIQHLPTDLLKINKDLSQAYNLLMENFFNPSINLKKLVRYDRIRDLYTLVSEIILKKNKRIRRQKRQKKQPGKDQFKDQPTKKQGSKKKSNKGQKKQSKKDPQQKNEIKDTQWTQSQQKFLCLIYLERSLFKCCEKLKQKYGDLQKWNTTRKVYKKAQQLFQRTLKRVVRSNQIKDVLSRQKINRQNLIGQIIQKKSNHIQTMILKFHRQKGDSKKKAKNMNDIQNFIYAFSQISPQKKQLSTKKQTTETQYENTKKEDNQGKQKPIKQQNAQSQLGKDDEIKIQASESKKQALSKQEQTSQKTVQKSKADQKPVQKVQIENRQDIQDQKGQKVESQKQL